MFYYNDSNRSLYESVGNVNVLSALKQLVNNNDLKDTILIGGLAVSYLSIPYRSNDIDILVRNKKKFNYFPNDSHRNGIKLDVYDIDDLNISENMFNVMKDKCLVSDGGMKIISATHLMFLYMNDTKKYLRCIYFLFKNSSIDDTFLRENLTLDKYSEYERLLRNNNKDYCMNNVKKYKDFITCKLYEGNSGFPEVDSAFDDWIGNTRGQNQVLIGGYAFMNYVPNDRSTQDIDFIFLTEGDIPEHVVKFKKIRGHCFRHLSTHVEIETLTSEYLRIGVKISELVFEDAFDKGDFKIASPSSIVALKLHRLDDKDLSDITNLMDNYEIDLTKYIPHFSEKALTNLQKIKKLWQ